MTDYPGQYSRQRENWSCRPQTHCYKIVSFIFFFHIFFKGRGMGESDFYNFDFLNLFIIVTLADFVFYFSLEKFGSPFSRKARGMRVCVRVSE